jgi:hypothetical protein
MRLTSLGLIASGLLLVTTPLMGADTLSPSVGGSPGVQTQGLPPATPDQSTGLPLGTLREPSQSQPLQTIQPSGVGSTGSSTMAPSSPGTVPPATGGG